MLNRGDLSDAQASQEVGLEKLPSCPISYRYIIYENITHRFCFFPFFLPAINPNIKGKRNFALRSKCKCEVSTPPQMFHPNLVLLAIDEAAF